VLEEAKRRGVGIDGLEKYRITRRDGPGALIFGYANLTERAIEEGIRVLAQAFKVVGVARAPRPGPSRQKGFAHRCRAPGR
jgi:GntR family transcriptional regulator/MocR family aminotransferase